MKSDDKTREQLLKEIDILKAKISKLQKPGIGPKKAKKALLIEKQLSENILETANAFILTLDIKADITLFNKFAEKLTGYKKEEVLGKNWFDLFIPKRIGSKIPEVFSNVLKKMPEFSSYENPVLCKNGSERLIRWENTVLKNENGEISGVLSIGNDITDREKIESKLKQNEKMLRQIINTSPNCIFVKDRNGMYIVVNNRMAELHNTTPEELVGKYDYEIAQEWFETVDYNKFRKTEQEVIDNKKTLLIDEEPFVYHGGTERWFHTTKIPFELENNKNCLLTISTDITKRKLAEKALKESQEHFHSAVKHSGIIFTQVDIDLRYKWIFNPHPNFNPNNLLGKRDVEIEDNEGTRALMQLKQRVIKNGQKCRKDIVFPVSDGPRTYDIIAEPVRDTAGKIVGVETLSLDVTERKKAEETLRDSEKNFRDLTDNLMDGVAIADENGYYIYTNPKFSEITGYSRDELLKMTGWDFTRPEDRAKLKQRMKDHMSGKPIQTRYKRIIIRKDGTEVPVEMSTTTTIWQWKRRPMAIIHDITKRKQAEKGLKKHEQFLNSILESVQDGVSVLDPDLTIRHVNGVMNKWYKEILPLEGKKCYEVYYNADKPCKPCPTLRCLESAKTEWNIVPGLTGSPVEWIELFSYPIKDPNSDKITGVVEFVRDITARKQAEEKLKENSLELEKYYVKSEKQRVATLSVLSDLNETTKELRLEIAGRKRSQAIQKTLFNISSALNTTGSMTELLSKIREYLGSVIDTTNFYVALYDEKTDMISLPYDVDEKDDYEIFPAGKTITKYVIETSKPLFATKDVVRKLIKKGLIETIGSLSEIWLGVPLRIENKVIGVIAVQSYDDPNLYSEKDIEILTFISEEIALVIQHIQADEQIRRELKEKELLLREVHHRVKNNLQVISGLLQLQQNEITTKEDALKGFASSQDRILAMAKAYELLLGSKYMSEVSVGKYITSLAEQLKYNYDNHNKVNITYSLDELTISIEILDRLGLILNEIITNAIKYAFEGRDSGNIHIELKNAEDHMEIKISDNGIGIPPKIKIHEPATLGLSIVDMLTQQLRGTMKLDRKNGTSFTLVMPKELNN